MRIFDSFLDMHAWVQPSFGSFCAYARGTAKPDTIFVLEVTPDPRGGVVKVSLIAGLEQ